MRHVVVKPFPFAGNGYTVENLVAGDRRDFGSMAAGLEREGWIVPVADEPQDAAAEPAASEPNKPHRGRPRKR